MKKRSIVSMLVTVLFLTVLTFQGVSQEKSDPPPPPPPPKQKTDMPPPPPPPSGKIQKQAKPSFIADIPDITDAQKEEIKKADLKNMKAMTELRNQIREKHAHLVSLLSSDDLDMNDVNKTIDEISVLNGRILSQQVSHHRAIRVILTPEQKIIYDAGPKDFLQR